MTKEMRAHLERKLTHAYGRLNEMIRKRRELIGMKHTGLAVSMCRPIRETRADILRWEERLDGVKLEAA